MKLALLLQSPPQGVLRLLRSVMVVWVFAITSACDLPQAASASSSATSPEATAPLVVPSPVPTPQADNAVFTANRTSGIAPLAVIFDASATSSASSSKPFHDLLYTWTFGDATGAKWNFGARPGAVDKNTDRGPIAGHVFEAAGSYLVTLDVFDGTVHRTATTTITVTDPDSLAGPYAGLNTVCIGQNSAPLPGDSGVPSGAKLVQASTWSQVIAQIVPGKRILLRKGDSWSCGSTIGLPVTASAVPTRIGSFGNASANPSGTVAISGAFAAFSLAKPHSLYEFFDLDFVGSDGFASTAFNGSAGAGVVVLRCSANLVASPVKLGGDDLFIQDNNFHDMFSTDPAKDWTPASHPGSGNLGIWVADSERVAILGNRVYDATAIEHNIRTQGAGKAVYAHNTLWGPGQTKHALAIRGKVDPVNPLNTIYPVITRFVVVADNLIDAGTNGADRLMQLGAQAGNYQEVLADILIEGNYLQGQWTSGIYSEVSYTLTVRNNLFQSSAASSTGLDIGYTNATGVPISSDTRFTNNSLYFSGTFASGSDQYSLSGQPSGLVIQNNLMYAPNASGNFHHSGVVSIYDGSMAAGTVKIGVNSTGGTSGQIKTAPPGWSAYPPASAGDWKPVGGSYGQGIGTAAPVWDDFYGTLRSTPPDLGAINHG